MPATLDAPKPAAGPELNILDRPPKNTPAEMPDSITAAALAMAGGESDEPKPEPKPAAEAPKPVAAKPAAEAPKPAQAAPPKKEGIEQVREAYARAQAKAEELTASVTATTTEKLAALTKVSELETRLAEREKKITEEYEPRIAVLTEKEKRLQQAEERLRIRDYTATTEWHEKYVKPIAEVETEVKDLLGELMVNVDGTEVAANMQHFSMILAAPNQTEAARRAEQLFGPHVAGTIANYRLRLKNLNSKRHEASERAALESIEYEKQSHANAAQQQESFRRAIGERETKYVAAFLPPDDDAELRAAHEEGRKFVQEVEQSSPANGPEKHADTIARARAQIQRVPVLAKKLSRLETENAELREQLKAYHKSDPDVETRRSGALPKDDSDWGDDITKAALAMANKP